MSEEVKVEKRVVTSLISLFGDIGGLREVFSSLIVLIVGSYQSKAFLFDQIESNRFRVAEKDYRPKK